MCILIRITQLPGCENLKKLLSIKVQISDCWLYVGCMFPSKVRRTECNVTDLGITTRSETLDSRCVDRGFVSGSSISGGVVCYNGTTDGSTAVYICNDGFVLMEVDKATRICQSDGNWSGSTPQCIPQEGGGMCCSQLYQFSFT